MSEEKRKGIGIKNTETRDEVRRDKEGMAEIFSGHYD